MLDQGQGRMQEMVERIRGLDSHKRQQLFAKLRQAGVKVERLPIIPASEQGPLALSFAQQRQWFLWQLDPQGSGYNIATALRLKGGFQPLALEHSLALLVQRHSSLRTAFVQQGEAVLQQVRQALPGCLSCETFVSTGAEVQAELVERVRAEARRPFDLRQDPLIRARLLKVAEDDHVLVLTLHHIIADGWSMNLLVSELMGHYAAQVEGRTLALPAAAIEYRDFAAWQRQWLAAGEGQRQLDYWTGQLGGEQPVLELPADRPRPAQQSFRGARLDFQLDGELTRALRRLAQDANVSLFMLLLAALQVLLHRYSGQNDIRVGVPVANRNREETEALIGFFVNTQVMRAELEPSLPFNALLQQVAEHAHQAQSHQDLPFEQLVEALQPERSLSVNPLFQVMFNHQVDDQGAVPAQALAGLNLENISWASHETHFDLTLNTTEQADGVQAALVYATDLFDEARMARMAGHWQQLLKALVAAPGQPIGQLALLEDDEILRFEQWNSPPAYPLERLIHQRIEDFAERTPEAVALVFAEQQMSFAQLDQQANRLAHELVARGAGPEVRVAVVLERGLDMMVALLAVLKAGAAYVPIDPQYPRQRLEYLINDCAMGVLLTQSSLQAQLPALPQAAVLVLDQLDLQHLPATPPAVTLHGDNLAYVIYTSGSTGQPKGVAVTHGPLAMHCQAIGERYAMSPADCELHFMSFAFDGAHERWLTTLSHGGRLLIRDDSLWTSAQTYQQMHRHGVSVAAFPPAYLQQLAEHAERDGNPPPVRIYCFGGDAVPEASFEQARRALRPQYIINGYGPTETVVTPLLWKADAQARCQAAYAPIGSRVGDRSAYVLDANLQQVPCGHPAELYLGGQGVARGYLQRPALTAERFVPDPFSSNGARLYRSGDLVRQRDDGVIDYLGRVDHQVKVRGFRIELGEIEARLQALELVRDAVVVARALDSGTQLVGYIVPRQASLDATAQGQLRDAIKAALKQSLAHYMIPAHWVLLEQLPLTPNGKLDRKALPAPQPAEQPRYVAAETELQGQLAALWQEVLKLEQVGLDDNFFEIGGHSLLATQVTAQVQLQLGVSVPLEQLFIAASLRDYADAVERCLNVNGQEDLSDLHDFLAELEAN
ncbi:amino acid adenylation domain-containing protein [Pseudomonas rubra]|uniref:Amino acid adenylation domain-containing protein n=1 Tax=Pseudomonas rubra TaxID=2942627 RepID=A0ABT5PBP0_9PSED|nr:amino acid adenylation domain-containing protein [Pseudomonas rubra]MDD1015719.1 amino acid adenylation domain-containing protein [Pseudomonas rubra]MDD1040341.1 amino acid adenylation domain-containing protein [Pseudomonas rubra]MDD1153932.1 amino acid adenylation domain-containing protein [Pseudomonas rubra]